MVSEVYTTKQYYGNAPGADEKPELSVLIGASSFMYAVFTQGFGSVTQLCHVELAPATNPAEQMAEKLPGLLRNFFSSPKNYGKVNVAFLNSSFALLPAAFGNGDSKTLLSFAAGLPGVKNLLRHQVKGIDFCYALEPELAAGVERVFSNASIRHAGAVNLNLLYSQHSLRSCQVFLNLDGASLELAIKEKDRLLFYNVFSYETNEDVLYYLLFTFEQFGLDPAQAQLCMAAQRPLTDSLITDLRKYVGHLSFCVPDPSVRITGELVQLPQHYYFTLLNQHLCEL